MPFWMIELLFIFSSVMRCEGRQVLSSLILSLMLLRYRRSMALCRVRFRALSEGSFFLPEDVHRV